MNNFTERLRGRNLMGKSSAVASCDTHSTTVTVTKAVIVAKTVTETAVETAAATPVMDPQRRSGRTLNNTGASFVTLRTVL